MSKGVILVDFDNVFYGRVVNAANIKNQLNDFILATLEASDHIENLIIRLYGGWKMNAEYTNEASVVLGLMETVNSELFPYIYNRHSITGDVELATSQYNLDIEWENTLQEKSTRHKLNVRTDIGHQCHHNPDDCPIHLIARATHGHNVPCPLDGCEKINVNMLTRLEQKMVDSMISCDILEYIHDEDCDSIEVVSDDTDLHPALALAGERYSRQKGVNLLLMINNKYNKVQYERILGAHCVKIQTWQ